MSAIRERSGRLDMEAITYEWLQTLDEEAAHVYYKNISPESERKEYLLTKAGAEKICNLLVNNLKEQTIAGLAEHIRILY